MNRFGISNPAASKDYMDIGAFITTIQTGVNKLLQAKGLDEYVPKVNRLVDRSGLKSFGKIYSVTLAKDGLAVGRGCMATDGSERGFLALGGEMKAITTEKLKMIPKDAVSFNIFSFDLPGLYDLVMEGIRDFDEEAYGEVMEGLKEFSGGLAEASGMDPVDIRGDLLGSLGSEVVMYQLKPTGMAMMSAPPAFYFIEMKDFDRFSGAIDRLFAGLNQSGLMKRAPVSLKSLDYEGHKIHYMQIQSGAMPFQPAFTNVDGYLVMGFQVSGLKKLIKNFGKSETSILDNEKFLSHYKKLKREDAPVAINWVDVKETFTTIYEQVAPMLGMALMAVPPEVELPFDLQMLPTSEAISKHLFSSLTVSYSEGDDLVWEKYGPFGPEFGRVIVGTLVAGVAAGVYYATAKKFEAAEDKIIKAEYKHGEVKPLDEGVPPDAQARKDLGALTGACFVYKVEHGRYPDSLNDLLIPTEGYPNGFYPPKELPLDPWGGSYHYKKFSGGDHKYMIWSCGPNGVDDGGKGDDIAKIK